MSTPIEEKNIGFPFNIQKYTVQKQIGKGAFGSVYLANDSNGSNFILKFINLNKSTRDDINAEIAALNSISDINECKIKGSQNRSVLCLVETFTHDNLYVLVTNYLENVVTLRDYITTFKKRYFIDTDNISFIMTKLLNQLEILHDHNIIHGDIKPENIVVQFDDSDKLLKNVKNIMFIDFGNSCNSEKCNIGGTITYMAPELLPLVGSKILLSKEDSKKTDVWSLGIVFYEILNHSYPFPYEGDRLYSQESNLINSENELLLIRNLNKYYKQNKRIFSYYKPQDEIYDTFNEIVDSMLEIDPLKRRDISYFSKKINIMNLSLFMKNRPSRLKYVSKNKFDDIQSAPLQGILKRYNFNVFDEAQTP